MPEKSSRLSFRYAAEGVLHCFRTQRHMQLHFLMLVLVLVSGLLLSISTRDMLLILLCIALVLGFELINSAVESLVDLVAVGYNPAAKIAKDVSAGAVLVASLNALIVGIVIFFNAPPLRAMRERKAPAAEADLTLVLAVGVLVLATLVISTKLLTGRSNPELLRGGAISGHAAIGFFLAMTIVFTSGDRLVGLLAIALALLVAQSRVDAGVHTLQQVVLGAVLAIFLTASVYWLMPRVKAFLAETASQKQSCASQRLAAIRSYHGGFCGGVRHRS